MSRRRTPARDAAPFTGPERIYAFADSLDADAQDAEAPQAPASWETWVTFLLAGETYAFAVTVIEEILRVGAITRVPDAPRPVRGIVSVRGRVVPVVDLRVRLGLPGAEPDAQARLLVASLRGRAIGLLVDAVHQVVRLDRQRFEPPPADVMTTQSQYVTAVCSHEGRLLILLDAEQVLVLPTAPDDAAPLPASS